MQNFGGATKSIIVFLKKVADYHYKYVIIQGSSTVPFLLAVHWLYMNTPYVSKLCVEMLNAQL